MQIKQNYPATDKETIDAVELQYDLNQLFSTINTLEYSNFKRPNSEFLWGNTKLKELLDPSGAVNDDQDLQVAVTKSYLKDALDTVESHEHDNKILLDTILRNKESIVSGTTDSSKSDSLMDSTATFTTEDLTVDMVVYNSTDDTYALVTEVTGDNELKVSSDIFVSGDDYAIYPIQSVELLDGDRFNSFTVSPTQKDALDEVQANKEDFGSGSDRIALMSDVPSVPDSLDVNTLSKSMSLPQGGGEESIEDHMSITSGTKVVILAVKLTCDSATDNFTGHIDWNNLILLSDIQTIGSGYVQIASTDDGDDSSSFQIRSNSSLQIDFKLSYDSSVAPAPLLTTADIRLIEFFG